MLLTRKQELTPGKIVAAAVLLGQVARLIQRGWQNFVCRPSDTGINRSIEKDVVPNGRRSKTVPWARKLGSARNHIGRSKDLFRPLMTTHGF